jgi:hypothetical protein
VRRCARCQERGFHGAGGAIDAVAQAFARESASVTSDADAPTLAGAGADARRYRQRRCLRRMPPVRPRTATGINVTCGAEVD